MASQWLIRRGGKTAGPMPAAKLKELAVSGHLRPTDEVQKLGMTKFVPASSVKGLFPAPADTTPASTPHAPMELPRDEEAPATLPDDGVDRAPESGRRRWIVAGAALAALVVGGVVTGAVLFTRHRGDKRADDRKSDEFVAGAVSVDSDQSRPAKTQGASETAPGLIPPGTLTVGIPTRLVGKNTRQVYRVHISALTALDAAALRKKPQSLLILLSADTPLVKALLPARTTISFADDYRSVRTQLLGVGVDTVYYFVDVPQSTLGERVPGYFVIPGTPGSLERLRNGLVEAGHAELAGFLKDFRPAADAPGWLIGSNGADPDGAPDLDKARKLERALAASCSLKPASLTPKGQAYTLDLDQSWPFTVVFLEPSQIGRVTGPLMTALGSPFGRVIERIPRATVCIFSEAVAPLPFQRAVLTFPSARVAEDFAVEFTDAREKIFDAMRGAKKTWLDDFNPLEQFMRSTMVVRTQNEEVALFAKPPLGFDVEKQYDTAQRMQDEDWTALRPPDEYQWELLALPGRPNRYDVLGRVRGVRVHGGAGPRLEPDTAGDDGGKGSRFRIPLAGTDAVTVTIDRHGNLTADLPGPGASGGLPTLDMLDEAGACVAFLRLELARGDPRGEVYRTLGLLEERLKPAREAQARAQAELDEARAQQQKEFAEAPSNRRAGVAMKWQRVVAAKETAVRREATSRPFLMDLVRKATALKRSYPSATLVPLKGPPTAAKVHPLFAKQEQYPFAGQWLLGDTALITLHQDTSGRVAGTLAESGGKPSSGLVDRSHRNYAILAGTLDGTTCNATRINGDGTQDKARLVLDPDGRGGRWEAGAGPTRIERLVTGLPGASWFQDEPRNFEGSWVNARRRNDNTTLEQVQPGYYEGWIAQGMNRKTGVKAYAIGNVIFLLHAPPATPPMRTATLSADGKRLSFVEPGAGVMPPRTVQLVKE